MSQYKFEHEKFVTGHNGTTFQEIGALTSIPCVGCFARGVVLLFVADGLATKNGLFLLDFLTLVMPSVISVTLMSDFIIHNTLIIFIFSALTYIYLNKKNVREYRYALQRANLQDQKAFISWYRSLVNLMTALAILAVDFPVFPRRLAKSETYGFGGMDNGVGFFVIANAIVSPEARGKHIQRPIYTQLKHCVVGCVPLLLLGLGRLLAVKATDYHEHITEYGVHWNFFFTLAALKLMSTLVFSVVNVDKSLVIGLAVTTMHQILLSTCGLSHYIMHGFSGTGIRTGILDANREGILSIPGYLAIYSFGVALGRFLFQKRENLIAWLDAAKSMFCVVLACTAVMVTLHAYVEQVSRRLANATFVFWIVGNGCLMLLECLLAEIAITCAKWARENHQPADPQQPLQQTYPKHSHEMLARPGLHSSNFLVQNCKGEAEVPDTHSARDTDKPRAEAKHPTNGCLLDAISYNALMFFLAANVMTGLVNMSMRTMYASNTTAVIVIISYLFVLCLVFVMLRRKNVYTKIW
ncbi:phosphatidylinositol-glycan biosynthesis class w protein [Plakobranchus ocellatus]|uniref:Phosphatidylinositol-glycan biosynthesis class W protein n=1 Tax=Plakobranchus ocellatus TaxID=259542 RepID=A0AAV3Z2I7_9GAST|nr:phosphatidylinositol-glycan biosynthesis class w protein [Plakobranchus ocellatus]